MVTEPIAKIVDRLDTKARCFTIMEIPLTNYNYIGRYAAHLSAPLCDFQDNTIAHNSDMCSRENDGQ
jgi:hypothetical protein